MKLFELVTPDGEQRRVKLLRKNAKHAQEEAKVAQARLKIKKAQQQLASASTENKPISPMA